MAHYRFGISEFTTWPWSLEEDVKAYPSLGADAIELCEFKLDADAGRAHAQLERIGASGLTVTSVQAKIHSAFPTRLQPEPHAPAERGARFREAVERIAPFAPGAPFVLNTGIAPNGHFAEAFSVLTREFRRWSDHAAEHGVRLAIEPLNPIMMNEGTSLWDLPQAMELVEAVGRDNFGVCVDTWNLWQDAALPEHIAACGDRIFVFQVADWRRPRSFFDRAMIGEGEIDFAPLLGAVAAARFTGPTTLELFSKDVPDSLYDRDLREVVSRCKAALDAAYARISAPDERAAQLKRERAVSNA